MPKKRCPVCDSAKTKKGKDARLFRIGQNRRCKECGSTWRTAPSKFSGFIATILGALALLIGIGSAGFFLVGLVDKGLAKEAGPAWGLAALFGIVFLGAGCSALYQGLGALKGFQGMDKERIFQKSVTCPACAKSFFVKGTLSADAQVKCRHCKAEVTVV